MKRAAAVLLILGVAAVAVTPRQAFGDTPTPTPSPTPSPTTTPTPTPTPTSMPSATDLLAQMDQVVATKNTVHEVVTLKLKVRKNAKNNLSETAHATTDVSISPVRVHEVVSTTGSGKNQGKTQKVNERDVLLVVGKRAAMRTNGEKWTCASAKSVAGTTTSVAPSMSEIVSATILGPDTVNNIPVWHVQVKVDTSSAGGSVAGLPPTIPEDIYISQSDSTLVRIQASISGKVSGVTLQESLKQDFSQYGETVSVKLPKACK